MEEYYTPETVACAFCGKPMLAMDALWAHHEDQAYCSQHHHDLDQELTTTQHYVINEASAEAAASSLLRRADRLSGEHY